MSFLYLTNTQTNQKPLLNVKMDSSCLLTIHVWESLRNHIITDRLFWVGFSFLKARVRGRSAFCGFVHWRAFLSVTDGACPRPGELGVEERQGEDINMIKTWCQLSKGFRWEGERWGCKEHRVVLVFKGFTVSGEIRVVNRVTAQ